MEKIPPTQDEEIGEALPGIPKRIDKSQVQQLPLVRFTGKVHLIANKTTARTAVTKLNRPGVLGFDTESRPSFQKGTHFLPAIVQFADETEVFIFQIQALGGLQSILPLLENPLISKAGVAIHDDVKRLKAIQDFEAAGFAEINNLSKKIGILNTGLRSLAALFLNYRISKGMQLSNWAKKTLSSGQISYAATDAWVSRELHLKLEQIINEYSEVLEA